MKILVFNFLNQFYKVDSIYDKNILILIKSEDKKEIVYADDLLKTLKNIFFLEENTLKDFINEWALNLNKKFKLKDYFGYKKLFIPVNLATGYTISQELVSVLPLSGPSADIFYYNCVYTGTTAQIDMSDTFRDRLGNNFDITL